MMMAMYEWEGQFLAFIESQVAADPGHDLLHIRRVVATAKQLAEQANACMEIVVPAAWLHDCVIIGKSEPLRRQASRLSAQRARAQLIAWHYPSQYIESICHSIEAHSFAAEIEAKTLEARILQDADRLDALGAIGIARCFSVGATLGLPMYQSNDPFCDHRQADDSQASLDHFYRKLLDLPELMSSEVGRLEAFRRQAFMLRFLEQLRHELSATEELVLMDDHSDRDHFQ